MIIKQFIYNGLSGPLKNLKDPEVITLKRLGDLSVDFSHFYIILWYCFVSVTYAAVLV
jgi:hypothetical protein